MNYISTIQASEKWGISTTRITILAKDGRIPGAIKIGNSWMIPENSSKPTDGRTKAAKSEFGETKDFFRFPLYVNGEGNNFVPSLTAEEKTLRQAELDFLACDFKNAEKNLKKLSASAGNIYVRTMSLFWMCLLSAICYDGEHYNSYFVNLEQELAKDFPNKQDMELLRPWLYISFTQYEKAADYLDFDINYNYSPSVFPLMLYLTYSDKISVENSEAFAMRANLYEITVRQCANSGNIFEAQLLHLSLFILYFVTLNEERMMIHLKNAMEIAYKYNFIYFVADAYPYYTSAFKKIFNDYPQEFADKIKQCGLRINESFSAFSKKYNVSDIFCLLSNNDIKFVLYAVQGYSNKQVANTVNASERTVANRYAEIYSKLGVDGKKELLEMLKK